MTIPAHLETTIFEYLGNIFSVYYLWSTHTTSYWFWTPPWLVPEEAIHFLSFSWIPLLLSRVLQRSGINKEDLYLHPYLYQERQTQERQTDTHTQKQTHRKRQRKRFILRNWIMQLQGLISPKSVRLAGWRLREELMLQLESESHPEAEFPFPRESAFFYSGCQLIGWGPLTIRRVLLLLLFIANFFQVRQLDVYM